VATKGKISISTRVLPNVSEFVRCIIVTAGYTNEDAHSACSRGVAARLREKQRGLERDAYNRGYRR